MLKLSAHHRTMKKNQAKSAANDASNMTADVSTFPPEWQSLFVKQKNDYSSGPACAATVAAIMGSPLEYDDFLFVAEPTREDGTTIKNMIQTCEDLSPISEGTQTYHGGLAIAEILMQPGMTPHCVVFLAYDVKSGTVAYYCPFYYRIFREPLKDICWISKAEQIPYWSINFEGPAFLTGFAENIFEK